MRKRILHFAYANKRTLRKKGPNQFMNILYNAQHICSEHTRDDPIPFSVYILYAIVTCECRLFHDLMEIIWIKTFQKWIFGFWRKLFLLVCVLKFAMKFISYSSIKLLINLDKFSQCLVVLTWSCYFDLNMK